jgi:hypothetical protein
LNFPFDRKFVKRFAFVPFFSMLAIELSIGITEGFKL